MVEIREVDGRFEVFAPGVHWEAFTDRQRAEVAAAEVAVIARTDSDADN